MEVLLAHQNSFVVPLFREGKELFFDVFAIAEADKELMNLSEVFQRDVEHLIH